MFGGIISPMRCWNAVFFALLLLTLCSAGCLTGTESDDEMQDILIESIDLIERELTAITEITDGNADLLSEKGLDSPDALALMAGRLRMIPYAHSSLVIGADGVVISAVPEAYAGIIGMDLSYQPAVQRANSEQAPIVSDLFWLVEGFYGISQSSPIIGTDGEYLGYTDITYEPQILIRRVVSPLLKERPYDLWVTDTDGTIFYDTTAEEIGRNLFMDPAYQGDELQENFRRIVSSESGNTEYTFWDRHWDQQVEKEAIWGTAEVHGTEWRVVITRIMGEGPFHSSEDLRPVPTVDEIDVMKAYVDEAAQFARIHGREEAVGAFNDPEGPFVEGEMYIFAYMMDGTTLALPFQQGLIGENRMAVSDRFGVRYIHDLIGMAARGGGSIYYIYPNSGNEFRDELKISYATAVDETWLVGSGVYLPGGAVAFDQAEIDDLTSRVHDARDFAINYGKEEALSAFNDLEREFAAGEAYIFAYAMDGTTLALPFQPEVIGSDRRNFRDRFGVPVLLWEMDAARSGGGFVYVTYQSPVTGNEGLKLCYVTPVDDEWFVGSGIYTFFQGD